MRIWLALPPRYPRTSGNWASAGRLADELLPLGIEVFLADADRGEEVPEVDVIHAFHAFKAGVPAAAAARARRCPLVVTLTGTDIWQDIYDKDHGAPTREVLKDASALIVLRPDALQELKEAAPEAAAKTSVIFPAVDLPEPASAEHLPPFGPGEVVFLLVAGLRKVKRPLFAVKPLLKLKDEGFSPRLVIAGPSMEREVAVEVEETCAKHPWITWQGELERPVLRLLYEQSHILLNTSLSEGVSNALLEGMSMGLAPLVSSIAANRSIVEPGVTGLTFSSEEDFIFQARRLVSDAGLRSRLGQAAAARVLEVCSKEKEREAHLEIYRKVTAKCTCGSAGGAGGLLGRGV